MDSAIRLLKAALEREERRPAWLARKLNVAPSTVSRYLAGTWIPGPERRALIESLLGVPREAWPTAAETRAPVAA